MRLLILFLIISLVSVMIGVQFGTAACGISWLVGMVIFFIETRLDWNNFISERRKHVK